MARLVVTFCQTGAVMETFYIIIAIVVVGLAVGGFTLLRPRLGGGRRGVSGAAGTGVDARPSATGTIAPPQADSAAATVEPAAPAAPASPIEPEIERPLPSAGRMVRLRGRLARSQNAFGSALLTLLSSGKLDDDTWDEIEEILITADMGTGPAMQLVERLRTEVKVAAPRPDRGQGAAQVRPARAGQPGSGPHPAHHPARRPARGRARRRSERHWQDDHLRETRPRVDRGWPDRAAWRRRYLPRGRRRPA